MEGRDPGTAVFKVQPFSHRYNSSQPSSSLLQGTLNTTTCLSCVLGGTQKVGERRQDRWISVGLNEILNMKSLVQQRPSYRVIHCNTDVAKDWKQRKCPSMGD